MSTVVRAGARCVLIRTSTVATSSSRGAVPGVVPPTSRPGGGAGGAGGARRPFRSSILFAIGAT